MASCECERGNTTRAVSTRCLCRDGNKMNLNATLPRSHSANSLDIIGYFIDTVTTRSSAQPPAKVDPPGPQLQKPQYGESTCIRCHLYALVVVLLVYPELQAAGGSR